MEGQKTIIKKGTQYIDDPLTEKLIGFCFDIYGVAGAGRREKYYENCLELLLKENNIKYERQKSVPMKFHNKIVGRQRLDFLIEGRIIVELKIGNYLSKAVFDQVMDYLKESNLKLGLIILFSTRGVRPRRVVNL